MNEPKKIDWTYVIIATVFFGFLAYGVIQVLLGGYQGQW